MPRSERLTVAKVAVYFPGQGVKEWPDIASLGNEPGLDQIVGEVGSAFKEAIGRKLADTALIADRRRLDENTLLAQVHGSYVSAVMLRSLLEHSYFGEPTLEQLMGVGLVKIQVSGDSAGGVDAALLPGPGHRDDQLEQVKRVAEVKAYRGELMLETEHSKEAGGMAAVTGYNTGKLNKIIMRVNNSVGPDRQGRELELVKHNAPQAKVIAGHQEALVKVHSLVDSRRFSPVSDYWFHHSSLRQVGEEFGRYLAQEGVMGKPSEIIEHVSYVTGKVIPITDLAADLAKGVWNPVYFYTLRGPSVHGAAHKGGFNDAIVLNREIYNWLRRSGAVVPHLATSYESLSAVKRWLMQVIYEGVKQGKDAVAEEARPPLTTPAPGSLSPAYSPR